MFRYFSFSVSFLCTHLLWISIWFHNPAFIFSSFCRSGPLLSTVADGPAAGTGRESVHVAWPPCGATFFTVPISGLYPDLVVSCFSLDPSLPMHYSDRRWGGPSPWTWLCSWMVFLSFASRLAVWQIYLVCRGGQLSKLRLLWILYLGNCRMQSTRRCEVDFFHLFF